MPEPTNKLLPIKLMAERLGVPVEWLRVEAEAGRIPHLKARWRLLFNPETVERVLLDRARETEISPDPGGAP